MTTTHGTGFRFADDPRDDNYPLASALDMLVDHEVIPRAPTRTNRYIRRGWRGDQYQTDLCVGFTLVHWQEAVGKPGRPDPWDPEWLVVEAQQIDEFASTPEGPKGKGGTSVRAALQVLRREGVISHFYSTVSVDDIARSILSGIPVAIGTIWTPSMFEPDADGFISPDRHADLVYGHATLLTGVNTATERFTGDNSWGDWGPLHGRYRVTFDDMRYLLSQRGRAWAATVPRWTDA